MKVFAVRGKDTRYWQGKHYWSSDQATPILFNEIGHAKASITRHKRNQAEIVVFELVEKEVISVTKSKPD